MFEKLLVFLIEIEIEIIYLPKKERRPLQIARANQGGGHQKNYKHKRRREKKNQ